MTVARRSVDLFGQWTTVAILAVFLVFIASLPAAQDGLCALWLAVHQLRLVLVAIAVSTLCARRPPKTVYGLPRRAVFWQAKEESCNGYARSAVGCHCCRTSRARRPLHACCQPVFLPALLRVLRAQHGSQTEGMPSPKVFFCFVSLQASEVILQAACISAYVFPSVYDCGRCNACLQLAKRELHAEWQAGAVPFRLLEEMLACHTEGAQRRLWSD